MTSPESKPSDLYFKFASLNAKIKSSRNPGKLYPEILQMVQIAKQLNLPAQTLDPNLLSLSTLLQTKPFEKIKYMENWVHILLEVLEDANLNPVNLNDESSQAWVQWLISEIKRHELPFSSIRGFSPTFSNEVEKGIPAEYFVTGAEEKLKVGSPVQINFEKVRTDLRIFMNEENYEKAEVLAQLLAFHPTTSDEINVADMRVYATVLAEQQVLEKRQKALVHLDETLADLTKGINSGLMAPSEWLYTMLLREQIYLSTFEIHPNDLEIAFGNWKIISNAAVKTCLSSHGDSQQETPLEVRLSTFDDFFHILVSGIAKNSPQLALRILDYLKSLLAPYPMTKYVEQLQTRISEVAKSL